MKLFIKKLYYYVKQAAYVYHIDTDLSYEKERLSANAIRLTHAIEKGLCVSNPRKGFGKEKIHDILKTINRIITIDSDFINSTHFLMVYDALSEYVEWHKKQQYSDELVLEVTEWVNNNRYLRANKPTERFGGTLRYTKHTFDESAIEKLFNNRHSCRTYLNEEIDHALLEKAISLANRYPSACNRQAVRLHIVNHNRTDCIKHWFGNNKSFWNDAKEFIMVCAKVSSYVPDEYQQYEVSAGIYVGYLTLALQTYGIGCCVIQREVLNTDDFRQFAKELNIPGDEQLICLIACGMEPNEYLVPISHRLSAKEMTHYCDMDSKGRMKNSHPPHD